MTARTKMHLVAYLMAGPSASYPSAWRHPAAAADDFLQPERWESLARTMEDALFDACFFADSLGIPDLYKGSFADYLGRGGQLGLLDPMTLLPLMSRVRNTSASGSRSRPASCPPTPSRATSARSIRSAAAGRRGTW